MLTRKVRQSGPDLTTHQAAADDLEKTTVRKQPARWNRPGHGPGITGISRKPDKEKR